MKASIQHTLPESNHVLGFFVIFHTLLMSESRLRKAEKVAQNHINEGQSQVFYPGLPDPKSYAFPSKPLNRQLTSQHFQLHHVGTAIPFPSWRW